MKKHSMLVAALSGTICMLSFAPAAAFAASDNAVTVSAPTYYIGGSVIAAPEKGQVDTEVIVTNNGTQAHEIVLITLVSKKGTGELVEISADKKTLPVGNTPVTLNTGVNFADPSTTEYQYYVWDENNTPLGNSAPGVPGDFQVALERMYGINLAWNASKDDKGMVDHYEISRAPVEEGIALADLNYTLLADDVSATTYQDVDQLDNGASYAYKIVAYDNAGLASSAAYTSGTTAKPLYGSIGHATAAEAEANSDGILVSISDNASGGDNYTGFATDIGPEGDKRACRFSSVRENGTSSFLYFSVDTTRILPTDNNLTIAITYFDQGVGNITLHYNSIGTSMDNTAACYKQAAQTFALTNSGQWKTSYITLTDASFQNIQGGYGTSARMFAAKDSNGVQQPFYVSEIRVLQTEKWMDDPALENIETAEPSSSQETSAFDLDSEISDALTQSETDSSTAEDMQETVQSDEIPDAIGSESE